MTLCPCNRRSYPYSLIVSLLKSATATTPMVVLRQTSESCEGEKAKTDIQDGGDKDKPAIDRLYKIIHQRYNGKDAKWEIFEPSKQKKPHHDVIFIVYYRYHPLPS